TTGKTDNDIIITGSGIYDIFAAGASRIDATIFNLSGAAALQGAAEGDNLTLDASSLAPGIYILRATADGSRTATRKIVI
ncbi:MAG: T9SS type A sorting domain-containing protein, partial [Muribaculaceae bacterium]|nr:T9SS type A sorting domain-containing protein [Muribaculaceae bacterium]